MDSYSNIGISKTEIWGNHRPGGLSCQVVLFPPYSVNSMQLSRININQVHFKQNKSSAVFSVERSQFLNG